MNVACFMLPSKIMLVSKNKLKGADGIIAAENFNKLLNGGDVMVVDNSFVNNFDMVFFYRNEDDIPDLVPQESEVEE